MKILIIFLALMVSGCGVLGGSTAKIDTPEKALKAANVTWINTMWAINKNAHRLSDSQKARLKQAVENTQKAWEGANTALLISNNVDFTENISVINTSIDILRAILVEIEDREVSNVCNSECYIYS